MLDSGLEGPGFQSGNSLRQTVHTHRASVHQATKLVAALLMVARATAGLAESNDSLSPGLWLTSPAGDCKELGSAPESYACQSSTVYLCLYLFKCKCTRASWCSDAENARPENDGQKLRGLENAGLENDGQTCGTRVSVLSVLTLWPLCQILSPNPNFSPSRFTIWISQTVYWYFWAYPSFLLFSFFLSLDFFSCRFRAVD